MVVYLPCFVSVAQQMHGTTALFSVGRAGQGTAKRDLHRAVVGSFSSRRKLREFRRKRFHSKPVCNLVRLTLCNFCTRTLVYAPAVKNSNRLIHLIFRQNEFGRGFRHAACIT
jgi:hypothetical protein